MVLKTVALKYPKKPPKKNPKKLKNPNFYLKKTLIFSKKILLLKIVPGYGLCWPTQRRVTISGEGSMVGFNVHITTKMDLMLAGIWEEVLHLGAISLEGTHLCGGRRTVGLHRAVGHRQTGPRATAHGLLPIAIAVGIPVPFHGQQRLSLQTKKVGK
jgi:hypothetical protein